VNAKQLRQMQRGLDINFMMKKKRTFYIGMEGIMMMAKKAALIVSKVILTLDLKEKTKIRL